MRLFSLAVVLLGVCQAHAKAVFAHFMVSNAANYTSADWEDEISLAQEAHIEAFALNTAYNQGDDDQYELAFAAAGSAGFKLFFSFDYAGNGAWPKSQVISIVQKYSGNSAHYTYNGKPFVSTFEGPDSAADWVSIKGATGCFFVPDWSSLGAKSAIQKADGIADGLFNWAAWPWGDRDMDTFTDASYVDYLDGKPYMMPVSPWFYTNMPGYNKNWLWKGDDLWANRWLQVLYVQPEWVEIISWNDYGESHYIGPIRNKALGAMNTGRVPIDYVTDMPHDAWRLILPFAIDMYVKNTTTVTDEQVIFWYRKQPASACGTGDTTGNTVSQLQIEFDPAAVLQDRVFFTAVLGSTADVSVSIGGVSLTTTWTDTPDGGGAGLYHGSVPFSGNLGEVVVTVSRSGGMVVTGSGVAISTTCGDGGLANWNAWVGSASSSSSISATPTSMDDLVCINGTSVDNFAGLCAFGCELGYCPLGACVCTAMGEQPEKPEAKNIDAYPASGLNEDYDGLCSFDCNYGFCPDGVCSTVSAPLTTPTVSPFLPPACTSGEGSAFPGLCGYACGYGFCPMHACSCNTQGALGVTPPIVDDVSGSPPAGVNDYGLCAFACPRGYCPDPCISTNNSASGGGSGSGSGTPVYIDPGIWAEPTPIVSGIPPCVLILPPYTLGSTTTIEFPPITSTFTESWGYHSSTTTVLTITFSAVTTDEIPVFNINITSSGVDSVTYTVTPSILPTATITFTPPVNDYDTTTTTTGTPVIVVVTATPVGSSIYPPITNYPTTVSFTSATPPGPTCVSGCGVECILFCSSCGILGCGGICPGCGGTSDCVGPYCDDSNDDSDDDCTSYTTVSTCTEVVSSTAVQTTPTTSWSTTTRTHCETVIDCEATGGTTTTTITSSDAPDPTANVDGTYDDWDINDYSDYQAVFASIESEYDEWESTGDIAVDVVTLTSVVTPTVTVTSVVIVTPTVSADCALWDEGWGWRFEIYNIANWATDGGDSLHKQEKGCGALTGWKWNEATDTEYAKVWFNLPFFIKDGCVERAIVSAGGPKISCDGKGLGLKKRQRREREAAAGEALKRQAEKAEEEAVRRRSFLKRTVTEAPSLLPVSETPSYVYSSATSGATYVPQTWNATDNGTVVLTWTLTTTSTMLITTEVPITANSTQATTVPQASSKTSSSSTIG